MIKEFLEEYSLFRKIVWELPHTMNRLPKPPINMECKNCGSVQTFNMINEYYEFHGYSNPPCADEKVRLLYECQSCRQFTRQFQVYISPELNYIYKFGQYPEWEIKMDKNLEKTLGKHAKTFRKGLVCESQGYGVGAFAYYRRITEEIIDELLESIVDLVEADNLEEYQQALAEAKKTRVAQEKIDLVKDLLPTILRPGGMNPLGVLHSELSEGLHAETDAKCLENASHVRDIITFLINQIIQSKESAKQFTSSMKSLLEKKSKK
jgi:ssDNA-binding Zn-finger/Zn-ribbon topoisomerase 1